MGNEVCLVVDPFEEVPNVAPLNPTDVDSLASSTPFRDGRPVLFSCYGGELLGDQVLFRNFFQADGHDDDSRAVDIRYPCPAPPADSL